MYKVAASRHYYTPHPKHVVSQIYKSGKRYTSEKVQKIYDANDHDMKIVGEMEISD